MAFSNYKTYIAAAKTESVAHADADAAIGFFFPDKIKGRKGLVRLSIPAVDRQPAVSITTASPTCLHSLFAFFFISICLL